MAQLTQEGFVARTLEQIIDEISGNLKATFGASFDTSPSSPDGQLIGIFAEQIWLSEQASQAAYQSSDPDIAIGSQLEYVCDYNGVYRALETPTRASVTFTGTAGSSVPEGMLVATQDGVVFAVDATSPISGEVSVTCTVPGAIVVNANEITEIKSPVAGITSVTNNASAATGFDRESDAQLRNRRAFSVIGQGTNTLESIYSELLKQGAEFVSIQNNDTDGTVGGVPPKSFEVIIKGLEDSAIFQSIYDNKPAGILAYGTTAGVVNDSQGYPHNISFSRPVDVSIDVTLDFKSISGASNDAKDSMEETISAFISGITIGESVIWSDIFGAAIVGANLKSTSTSINNVLIGVSGGTLGAVDISMAPSQKPVVGTITITEV